MSVERLRLVTKVARLYYEQGLRQPDIARELCISQAMVSRLLAVAHKEGIVRTTVMAPLGVHGELEDELKARFKLKDSIVADCAGDSGDQVLGALGQAAASYLHATLRPNEVVGISFWSETLLRTIGSMRPKARPGGGHVVQISGGTGSPAAQAHAARCTKQVASLLKAEAHFLSSPGAPETRGSDLGEHLARPETEHTTSYFNRLTVALVGIGTVRGAGLLGEKRNIFSVGELREFEELGAVGDVCLRFFDRRGRSVASSLNDRPTGVTLDQLRRVPRTVGIAGGAAKLEAISGALAGGLINVLVTDRMTAERLVAGSSSSAGGGDVSFKGSHGPHEEPRE